MSLTKPSLTVGLLPLDNLVIQYPGIFTTAAL